jgi:RimJ/RimL family protein N-acetyltransferase
MDTLETKRLRLRPFTMDDVDAYYAGISSDADVMRYLPGGQPRQRSDSHWVINYFRNHALLHGFGVWAVEELAAGTLIGHAGLEYIPGVEKIEVAYTFAKAYWGRGYATEAAAASLEYGFESLNLPEVYGLAFPANTASQNVMRKIGMELLGVTHDYYGLELACFHLNRESYFAAHKENAI